MRKIWIVGLMAFSLFAISLNFAIADDEVTLTDEAGDVYDYDADENTTEKPNIDIRQLTVSIEGNTITFELVVENIIEDKGNIGVLRIYMGDEDYLEEITSSMSDTELEEFLNDTEMVIYSFSLESLENSYTIMYVNGETLVLDLNLELFESNFSVDEDKLTISFEYDGEDEFAAIYALTSEATDLNEYSDEIYGEFDTENGDTGDTGNQDTGDDNGSAVTDNTTFLFFIAIIAAICVMGVAVLVFIIRR